MKSILSVREVVKAYANHLALDKVSIEVPEASIYGLLGPNGAGKTSLIRIINQITGADEGSIYFDGSPLQSRHVEQIGYLPEERGLYKKMKVGEQALYLAQLKGMPKAKAKEKLLYWFKKFDMLPWWDKKVEALSKGMAQKVQFIITILHEPKLLILDEPFSGFDPINTQIVKTEILRLKEAGTTVILSTHNMGSVEEICEHIALINKSKKVLEGSVNKIKERFKQGIYEIRYKGNLISFTNALGTSCELQDNKVVNGYNYAKIKLKEGNNPNNILKAIVPQVEVHGLHEVIPSMNEIFISEIAADDTNHKTKENEEG